MLNLLRSFSWQEVVHHPWRNAAAVVAIMLGVALAFAVHLINASALTEFSSAVHAVNGQPDVELRSVSGNFSEALYARAAQHPGVELASPVLEVNTYALNAQGNKLPLKVLGLDALVAASISPAVMPRPDSAATSYQARVAQGDNADAQFKLFAANTVFLNPSARSLQRNGQLTMLAGLRGLTVHVAGSVTAGGAALAVMDIGAAQELFGLQGQINRIDLRLAPGSDRAAMLRDLALPAGVQAQVPGDAQQRIGNLSRAYRVNMTVLALVALFTGAFLVFSVLSLSVAKRAQQLALLGVLGLTQRQSLSLVLLEATALGTVGSVLGIALGAGLAALALQLLGGDLGGGYFAGAAPSLQWSTLAASVYGALGVSAALAGAWWPARAAQSLPLVQTLKGLGALTPRGRGFKIAAFLIAASACLVWLPAVFNIPIGAYAAIGLLLLGAIGLLPGWVSMACHWLAPLVSVRALPLLSIERARRIPDTAAIAVSGVVAALSLAVALTVMVASFRTSVMQWLDVVLPAPLYLRTASSAAAAQLLSFSPSQVAALQRTPGVARVVGLRTVALQLDPAQPSVLLIARSLTDPAKDLPLVQGPVPPGAAVPAHAVPLYVSEAMQDLYAAKSGQVFKLNMPLAHTGIAQAATDLVATPVYYVAGVWRDYARQFGAIAIDQGSYARITGDLQVNDVAVWLQDGASLPAVQAQLRATVSSQFASRPEDGQAGPPIDLSQLVEFSSAADIRAISLRIFDRSFAVTYWLQAVAIAMGLFGVAASFSAQVLARRKEFGLLAHLGLTRRQILQIVAIEGATWTAIGALAGCALGLWISLILVHVVNPQSFHWTMDLTVPWLRLAWLCLAVVAAGTLTAWLAGRSAAGRDAVLAVKEDW